MQTSGQLNDLQDWMQELRPHLGALAAAAGAMVGAGVFFELPFDPWWGWGLLAVGLGLVIGGVAWRKSVVAVALGIFMGGLVFCLAGWQVQRVETIDFAKASKVHWLVGTVTEIAEKPDKANRVTLRVDKVDTYGLGQGTITRAGIGVYKSQVKDVAVGTDVALPVVLLAPEGPKYGGERDGRLWRFFNGGGVGGYVLGTVEPTFRVGGGEGGVWGRWQVWLEGLRGRIFEGSKDFAGGAVAALLMGEEKAIGGGLREAYRKTGLSHLLAISGMQLTIVALGIFWVLRWLGALVPWVALRVNIRFWAVFMALLGTVFYTLLAGASVSLVRASIMAGIVMLAVMMGRMRSALRAWCAAVVLVLMVNPVMVTRAGFQLSVAAVLGLILLAMAESGRWQGGRFSSWLRGLVLATVVAGCMTAPVLVANFGQFSVLGMVANLVAVPVMALATYLGMVALVLWPLGLQKPVLDVMAVVVGWVNTLAEWLSGMQLASVSIDRDLWWVVGGFALVAVASVLVRRWVEAGVAVVSMTGVVLVVAMTAPKPEVLIWEDGAVGLVRNQEPRNRGSEDLGYRLMWAEDVEEALRMAKGAGVKVVVGEDVPETVDEALMPVTELEHFAFAERVGGVWRVEPITCGRVWERMAEGCWRE